ncbi:MAG: S9 family peptidase, partial [Candidatus Eremiobacteraeota bacterium]|nr:S9 family peptidase [Candidatus Eremiobacteraeota bacterium]
MKRSLTIVLLAAFTATAAAAPVTIQPYLDIRGQSVPAYAPNGAIAFFTSVTGVAQVWKTDRTNAYPIQLTYGTQRAQFATFLPDGRLLYGSDHNSDENTQFYIANGDGSNVARLLPKDGDDVRHEFSSISADGHFISFTSNAADRGVFNPYVLNLKTGAVTALAPGPLEVYAGAFSHDGKRVLVAARSSNFDSNLSVVDIQTRATVAFTRHTGNALFECAGFLPDNRTAVCATDKGREFVTRALIDTQTGAIHFLEPDRNDVGDLTLSDDGKFAAYVRNVDGNGSLIVSDAASGRTLRVPQLPERAGVPSDLAFDKAAKHLAYMFSGGQHPAEILESEVRSGKTVERTRASLAGLSRGSFVEPKLITWKSFNGRSISGWLYKPANAGNTYPVVLDIHGGPEAQTRPTFSPIDQYFAAHGYAVLAPNVRGSTGYGRTFLHLADVRKREDSVKDIHAAYQYLTAHGADPKRVAVYGGSYGGYMVLASLTLYP